MRRLSIAGIAGLLLMATAPTASAIEVWQGHLFVTAANQTCRDFNWTVDNFVSAVFRPNGLEDNGDNTLLALFRGDRYAARYVFTEALAGNGTYAARHITSTAGGGAGPMGGLFEGNYARGRVRPVPAVGKPTLQVRVRLADFANIAGCVVTLEGSLGLRPNL